MIAKAEPPHIDSLSIRMLLNEVCDYLYWILGIYQDIGNMKITLDFKDDVWELAM